jgi:cytochrome P450
MRRASEKDAGMIYRMELVKKHGYVYVTGFGPSIRLTVIEPDMLADIFGRSHAQDYRKPTGTDTFFKPLIGVHNLLVSEGAEHERARKMLNPAFHFVKLQSMISIMVDQTSKAINELLLLSAEHQVINLQTELNTLTLAIIASSAFGKGFETMANAKQIVCRTFTELLEVIEYRTMRMISQIPIISQLPFWRKDILDKVSREVSEFVDQIIADRRHNRSNSLSSSEDLLDLLLSAVDTQGQSFNDQEIKDQALTFVFAGHETTGNLMTWAMYVLMTNEKVLQACQDEVDRVLPNGIEPAYEHMNELIVWKAVLQETLRLHPLASFVLRSCIREHYMGSEDDRQIRIPVGTVVLLNTYILHRREQYWPRPLEFDYTRWIRDPVTGLTPKLAYPF